MDHLPHPQDLLGCQGTSEVISLAMSSVGIGFPARCRYRGGNRSLGAHGRQLWIKDGRIGHGRLRLSHSIPIETVERIELSERAIEGVVPRPVLAQGLAGSGRRSAKGERKTFTDIFVHTADGETALWVVEQRDADRARRKLSTILDEYRIRLN